MKVSRPKRKTLMLAVAAAGVLALIAGSVSVGIALQAQRFNDVPTDHYAYDAVEWAVAVGVTSGCGDGTDFCPADTLNRAQMVTFLKRYHDWFISGKPPGLSPEANGAYPSFELASETAGDWYNEMVATLDSPGDIEAWNRIALNTLDNARVFAIGITPELEEMATDIALKIQSGDTLGGDLSGDLDAARFYAAAAGWVLASAGRNATKQQFTEREMAASAAWSYAGARITQFAHDTPKRVDIWYCECVMGPYESYRFRSRGDGIFEWEHFASAIADLAQANYFDFADGS